MKKAFIQKLSIAMASALVITAAAPATADAAASMALNKKSKVLYLNQDNMTNTADSFDFNIKNKGANYKSKYKFKWTVSNSNVKVNQSGVVTAKKVGKTTVKCTVTKKSTGKVYKTLSATVEVKANAETVAINNAPENNQIAVGTSFDFNRTMKAANGGKATDKTEWFLTSDAEGKEALDKSIATVDSKGVVTALQAGEFYVFAKTYQSKATKEQGYTAVSEGVKITAPLEMTDVKLTKVDTVELTFNSSVKDVIKSKEDVKIQTVAANKVILPVKSATVSEDGKTVTVVSYANFTNDTTYAIAAAKTSKEFKAQIGTIAKIEIANQVVAPISNVSDAKELAYTVYDEFGVDVTNNYKIGGQMTVESTSTNASYITGDGKLCMFNKGDVVSVRMRYYKYNPTTGADESVVSNIATVTCADIAATGINKWTIAASGDFSQIKQDISVGQEGKYLNVVMKDNYGNDITSGFKFTSLDDNKLAIDRNTGKLYPLAAGTVTVKIEKGDFVAYVDVVVKAEATFATITASSNNFVLSNKVASKAGDTVESKTVKIKLTDSYGDAYSPKANEKATIKEISNSGLIGISKTGVVESTEFNNGELELVFTANATKTGAASYRVEFGGKAVIISVTTKTPSGVVDYKAELDKTELDSYKSETATLTVYGVDAAGVKSAKTASGDSIKYTVKDASGNVKVPEKTYTENGVEISSEGLTPGTYNVYVNIGAVTTKTVSFTVKSTQTPATFSTNKVVVDNVVSGEEISAKLAEAFTVKVGGKTVTASSLTFETVEMNSNAVDGTKVDWSKGESELPVLVKKIKFSYTDDKGITSSYELTVNTKITLKK